MTEIKEKQLRIALSDLHIKTKSWRSIANMDEYKGVPPGTLCSIAKGAEVPGKYRARFGLAILKPAPVCKCGEVHTTKRCTANDKPRRKKDLFAYSVRELRWMLENRE